MDGDEVVGFWAEAAKEKMEAGELGGTILRDAKTGRIVTLAEIGPIQERGTEAWKIF